MINLILCENNEETVVTKAVMKHKLCKGKFCYLKRITKKMKDKIIYTLIHISERDLETFKISCVSKNCL